MRKEVEFTIRLMDIVDIDILNAVTDEEVGDSSIYDVDYEFVKLDKHGDLTIRANYELDKEE